VPGRTRRSRDPVDPLVSGQVPVRQKFVHDTWAARDLPVLEATVALLEQSYMVTVTDIATRTGLDVAEVARALEALDPTYVDFRKTTTGGDARFWYVFKVTPEARRAVGQWPTAQSLAGRLAEELAAAAKDESDPQRQGLLAYAARLVGDTLRDATVRAAEQVLSPAFGGVPQPELGMPVPEPAAGPVEDLPGLVPLPELPELLRPQRPDADAAEADEADTDLDLAQSRRDASSAV
jgi:predicted transcriptional regulator